jgi:hypothetical protein
MESNGFYLVSTRVLDHDLHFLLEVVEEVVEDV